MLIRKYFQGTQSGPFVTVLELIEETSAGTEVRATVKGKRTLQTFQPWKERESETLRGIVDLNRIIRKCYVRNFILKAPAGWEATIACWRATDEDIRAESIIFEYEVDYDFWHIYGKLIKADPNRDSTAVLLRTLNVCFSHDNSEEKRCLVEELTRLISSKSDTVRREIAIFIRQLSPYELDDNIYAILLKLIHDKSSIVVQEAIMNLEAYGDVLKNKQTMSQDIRSRLEYLLQQPPNTWIQCYAVEGLGAFGGAESLGLLISTVRNTVTTSFGADDPITHVKQAAIVSMKDKLNDPEVESQLSDCIYSELVEICIMNLAKTNPFKIRAAAAHLAADLERPTTELIDTLLKEMDAPLPPEPERMRELIQLKGYMLNALTKLLPRIEYRIGEKELVDYQIALRRICSDNEIRRFRYCQYFDTICRWPMNNRKRQVFVAYSLNSNKYKKALEIAKRRLKEETGIELYYVRSQPDALMIFGQDLEAQDAFCTTICRPIQQSLYMVADLSERSTSVGLEIGLAQKFGVRVAFTSSEAPIRTSFDLVGYKLSIPSWSRITANELAKRIYVLCDRWFAKEAIAKRIELEQSEWLERFLHSGS